MRESELMPSIRKRLEIYILSGPVIWFERLQSFKIRHYGNWMQGCKTGTPDWVVVLRNSMKNISIIFLEAKSDTGTQRKEQKEFELKHHNGKDILYYVIREPRQVDHIINELGYDRLQDLPDIL